MLRTHRVYLLLLLFLLIFSIPVFFHKLGASSLTSFDEAWYAAIARNITLPNPFQLYFNGGRFYDHPPAGFWLIRTTQLAFGVDEFGSRAAAAILGLASLALIFILGCQISSPAVGLASAVALLSSPWFISRARSANLDVPLTFFFLLTFILAFLAARNKRFLIPFSLSLTLLLLTKTLIPFTLLPSLLIIFWPSPHLKTREFIFSSAFILICLSSWFISQISSFPGFLNKYLSIGYPKLEKQTSLWQNILLTKTYLHESTGTWFRPAVITLPLSLFFLNRRLVSLLVFMALFLLPFAFSSRGQIWHLIPVIPFLILIGLHVIHRIISAVVRTPALSAALTLTLTLLVSAPQISKNWREFIDIPAYVSDEAILSASASGRPEPLYIDDRFLPAAVYYSGKIVNDRPTPDFSDYFNKPEPILLITRVWRLEQAGLNPDRYQLLAADRDKILLLIPPAPSP
jgi:4-amino-4-deoxy-L-arabinose transferase-like glycosyltransferase